MPASNEMISYSTANANFTRINPLVSPGPDNQMVTKLEALTKYYLISSFMDGYSDNQLVPFSTWVSPL
jgi:hypothetical protein